MKTTLIDARPLRNEPTGIGRYLAEIISNINNNSKVIYLVAFQDQRKFIEAFIPEEFEVLYINSSIRFFRYFIFEIFVFYLIKKYKIENYWAPAGRLPFFIPKKVKIFLTIHDLVFKYQPRSMSFFTFALDFVHLNYALKFRSPWKIFTVSRSVRDELIENYSINKEIILLTPNASSIQVRGQVNSKRNGFLFVGTIEPRKNIKFLIDAYLSLPRSYRLRHKLTIVGKVGWSRQIKNLVKIIDQEETIIYNGYCDNSELERKYTNSLCLVFPSIYEGFGIPLVEALSLGCFVIASNIKTNREILEKEGGWFFDLGNKEQLRTLLLSIEKISYNSQAIKERQSIANKYSWIGSARIVSRELMQ